MRGSVTRIGCATVIVSLLGALAACGGRAGAHGGGSSRVITDIGSDTIVNLALAWAEEYAKINPAVRVSVTGGGSGTGIGALINGTAAIANASRKMKKEEYDLARERGVEPEETVIAQDAIAVVINRSNPVRQLTIQQLSDIFSGKIRNWAEVGGERRPIVRLSREVNSGTHVYFLESVVRRGRKNDKTLFAEDTLLLPSSEGISMEVTQNPNAIGYDGLGYVTDAVKVVAVAVQAAGPYVLPSAATVRDRTYPIARDLYMYTGQNPRAEIKAYLAWILGPQAQQIVRQLGFVPVQGAP